MANTIYTQQALASDARFRVRVQGALITKALLVMAETPPAQSEPPTQEEEDALNVHLLRVAFAVRVLKGPVTQTELIAPVLVTRTNLNAFETSYDFSQLAVVTLSGDADIASQIATDWDLYSSL